MHNELLRLVNAFVHRVKVSKTDLSLEKELLFRSVIFEFCVKILLPCQQFENYFFV